MRTGVATIIRKSGILLMIGTLACRDNHGLSDPDAGPFVDEQTQDFLRSAIVDFYQEHKRWPVETDNNDVAAVLKASLLASLPLEIRKDSSVCYSVKRGSGEFVSDHLKRPFVLLIDVDGSGDVVWKEKHFKVRDMVRIVGEREISEEGVLAPAEREG